MPSPSGQWSTASTNCELVHCGDRDDVPQLPRALDLISGSIACALSCLWEGLGTPRRVVYTVIILFLVITAPGFLADVLSVVADPYGTPYPSVDLHHRLHLRPPVLYPDAHENCHLFSTGADASVYSLGQVTVCHQPLQLHCPPCVVSLCGSGDLPWGVHVSCGRGTIIYNKASQPVAASQPRLLKPAPLRTACAVKFLGLHFSCLSC